MSGVPTYQPGGNQAKVKVRKDRLRPLIVEWAASDRADLEAKARTHPVVVRYTGDSLSVLPRCRVDGAYRYEPTTPKHDHVHIGNLDELKANLPLGAASLEGRLKQTGRLDVNMDVVGQYELPHDDLFRATELKGDCAGATHVITTMTVGAFEFTAGGSIEAGGGIGIAGAGVQGQTQTNKQVLSKDGNVDACSTASREDTEPPQGCGAIVRIAMAPIRAQAGSDQVRIGVPGALHGDRITCGEGERLVQGTCVRQNGQNGSLFVTVTCGTGWHTLGPEHDGLVVVVDGEEVKPERVQHQRLVSSPGTEPPVLFVVYPISTGTHTVKVSANECQPEEREIEVRNDSGPYHMFGRLRSDDLFQQPPAAAAAFGFSAVHSIWLSKQTVPATADVSFATNHQATFRDVTGWGGGIFYEVGYFYFGWEFSVLSGKADMTLGQQTTSTDISRTGTHPTFDTRIFYSPTLIGARLPLTWVNLLAGTGGTWGISSYSGDGAYDVLRSSSMPFAGLPVWAEIEARPVCYVSLGARVTQEFTTPKTMPNSLSTTLFLSVGGATPCSDDDFGIR